MKIYTIIFSSILILILLSKCSSSADKKDSFKLEVYDSTEEKIKEFKIANIMPYFKDGKWGYSNKKGEVVIPCQYESCGFFSDGMAWVGKDMKFGYIDTTGVLIIMPEYDGVQNFFNGLAITQKLKYKGIIDKKNNIKIPFKYEDLFIANDGFIHAKQNQQWGMITLDGKQLINPIYDNDFEFENNLAVVRRANKYGVINRAGIEVIVCKYDGLTSTNKGDFIVLVRKSYENRYYGVVDSTDKIKIPIVYKNIEKAVNNFFIVENDNGAALLNAMNDTIVDFKSKKIIPGNTNLLAVSTKNDYWGYINLKGDTIIPFLYSDANAFINNFAIVKNVGYGIINSVGEPIVPFEFDKIFYVDKQIVKVYKNDKYGFYNLSGQKLTDCIYDDLDYTIETYFGYSMPPASSDYGKFNNNYAVVGIDGRLGAIDKQGKVVVPLYYHSMSGFDIKGVAIVSYKNRFGLVDKTGKALTEIIYPAIKRDEISGYYYLEVKDERRNEGGLGRIKSGYFDFDGKFYSNCKIDLPKIDTDEEIVEKIRKEYQRNVSLQKGYKASNVIVDDTLKGTIGLNRIIVSNSVTEINYEYYYDDNLNKYGPFFILKTDKNSGKTLYDRYYFYYSEIVRWVDKSGKQQLVANGPYAPENIEHFIARYSKAACENQYLINNSKKNKEVSQIEKLAVGIDDAILLGEYKKGDIQDNSYENGSSGSEEYLDKKGNIIYKKFTSDNDHFSNESIEYFKNGKLMFSKMKHTSYGLMGFNELFGANAVETTTVFFDDGTKREYKTTQYRYGEIQVITEE